MKAIGEVNDALIDLKRNHLFQKDAEKYFEFKCTENTLLTATTTLLSFLEQLIGNRHDEDWPDLPDKLLNKIKQRFPDLTKLTKQFKGIKKDLQENKDLHEDNFELLDRIVTEFDMERSKLLKY